MDLGELIAPFKLHDGMFRRSTRSFKGNIFPHSSFFRLISSLNIAVNGFPTNFVLLKAETQRDFFNLLLNSEIGKPRRFLNNGRLKSV